MFFVAPADGPKKIAKKVTPPAPECEQSDSVDFGPAPSVSSFLASIAYKALFMVKDSLNKHEQQHARSTDLTDRHLDILEL